MAAQNIDQEELNKILEEVKFPASKEDILKAARQKGATQDTLNNLQKLPDTVFQTVNQLTNTLNKLLSSLTDTLGKLL